MLKLEPGREEEARYWLANLAVNAAVMRVIECDAPPAQPTPPDEKRRSWRRLMPRATHR
ncbi:MAG: hypothetical protein ABI559_05695 [Chloroflexota bacterium]